MSKYVCSICGYIYDEAAGIPEADIAPGTKWEDLPEDWVCPLCGAAKSDFEKQGEPSAPVVKKPISVVESSSDMKEMSPLEISALCTNLARGCEKQYKAEEAALFNELAGFFKTVTAPAKEPSVDKLVELIEKDLAEGFPNANAVASNINDRGALRALVWSEKVTRILKSLLNRYQKEGDTMLQNTGVYVCTICGFVYVGDTPPDICPVCKVPNWKFEKVEGRS
ncbi:rubredoxin [Proteiniclasticum sp. QWL-01]|uniref:rubredoxin n=1 Tax=Proteiniclasticum sp. QWL-01 TaxID=3036945 RepID=UPI002410903B|nr:rubredoxin [Proteiniclasticum sp. QWL-01]WFF72649.1 rubredoxin [Proteiniclasticum sp. QWL-01]